MQFPTRRLLVLTGFAVAALSWPLTATAVEPLPAAFNTIDGVRLKGDFYRGSSTKPTILLITKIGSKHSQEGWKKLAEELNRKEYAVLSFDLRGCGDSTRVNETFWTHPLWGQMNSAGIKGRHRLQISYKEFKPHYLPWLVNDIAAAKNYLDQQNNASACNSRDVVLVGAESGAALGALWLAAEWQEYPRAPSPLNPAVLLPIQGAKPIGNDVAAAVWLTMPWKWNGSYVHRWLTWRSRALAGKPIISRVPMGFVWGKADSTGARSAKEILAELGRLKNGSKAGVLYASHPLPGRGKGAELLGRQNLDTGKFIQEIIDKVMDERGPTPWSNRADALMPVSAELLQNLGAKLQ